MERFQGEAGRESASSSSCELPWARRTGAEESMPSPLRCTPGWILGTKPRYPGWTLASATNVVGVVGEACGWRGRSVVAADVRQHLNRLPEVGAATGHAPSSTSASAAYEGGKRGGAGGARRTPSWQPEHVARGRGARAAVVDCH
jgi:hypothetical protein